MPQTQPPVIAVTTTRNAVTSGVTSSSNNGAYVIGPCVAPGGLHRRTSGDSTQPQRSALLDWFDSEAKKLAGEHDQPF